MRATAWLVSMCLALVLQPVPALGATKSIAIDVRQGLSGIWGVEAEVSRSSGKSWSLQVYLADVEQGPDNVFTVSTTVASRQYLRGTPLDGPYTALGPEIAYVSYQVGTDTGSIVALGATASVGTKLITVQGLSIDLSGWITMPIYAKLWSGDHAEDAAGGKWAAGWRLFAGYAW